MLTNRLTARRPERDGRGFATVWVLGLSLIIVMFALAVIDVWNVYATQRTLTARADAAAAAGAQAIDLTEYSLGNTKLIDDEAAADSAQALTRERLDADFVHRVESACGTAPLTTDNVEACVSVDNSTPNQPTVTVVVRKRVSFMIFRILGYPDQTVDASATAGPR